MAKEQFKLDEVRTAAVIAECIPQEMFWAYETVRQSGYWNMFVFNPVVGRYHEGYEECLQTMDDIYVKYCAYTNADISQPQYKHIMQDHILLIQNLYSDCMNYYGNPPEGVVNLTKTVKTEISF